MHTARSTIPYVNLNDGTVRLTIRWKPTDYDQISDNSTEQTKAIKQLCSDLFDNHMLGATLIPWIAQDTNRDSKSVADIILDHHLNDFLSPKITFLETTRQIIFGVRAYFGASPPSLWITQPSVKHVMTTNNIQIGLSNSTCTSGDVVTAGHILLKSPKHTHKHFYLLALRRKLPDTTPFFDLGILSRTPHGESIPHLIVRCGSHHVNILADLLSNLLDGSENNTAMFLPSAVVSAMTLEESQINFKYHSDFIAKLQRIPLHPFVINIDRHRKEHIEGKIIERSTRDWISTLRLPDGSPMQCDVENGSPDKRAYILAPTPVLAEVKQALEQYRHQLRQAHTQNSYRNTQTDGLNPSNSNAARPTEIYVPTEAVLRNLQRMKRFTSAEIWKAAPNSIRTPAQKTKNHKDGTATTQVQPLSPTAEQKSANHRNTCNSENQNQTPLKNNTSAAPASRGRQQQFAEFPPMVRRPSMDTTVGTTQSPTSRTTTAQSPSFVELEAAFYRHQSEFTKVTTTVLEMDDRVTRTMAACNSTAQQILLIEGRLDQITIALQHIANNTATQIPSPATTTPNHPETQGEEMQDSDANRAQLDDTGSVTSDKTPGSSNASMNTATSKSTHSSINKSPEKKKTRPSTRANKLSTTQNNTIIIQDPSDQQGRQYTSNSPSDGGSHF